MKVWRKAIREVEVWWESLARISRKRRMTPSTPGAKAPIATSPDFLGNCHSGCRSERVSKIRLDRGKSAPHSVPFIPPERQQRIDCRSARRNQTRHHSHGARIRRHRRRSADRAARRRTGARQRRVTNQVRAISTTTPTSAMRRPWPSSSPTTGAVRAPRAMRMPTRGCVHADQL